MISTPSHPNYFKNVNRCGAATPCVICGKAVTTANPAHIHLHNGGASIVTEAEAATMDPAADLGLYPIGADCLRRYPELRPYAQ